jgi:hypothetical protein
MNFKLQYQLLANYGFHRKCGEKIEATLVAKFGTNKFMVCGIEG